MCRDEREELHGALKHETVALRCDVDANPPLVSFQWTFNNSGDLNEVPVTRYTSSATTSHLNYTPVSDMDYGTLACWGTNAVGHQKVPCVFQVVAAGTPLSPGGPGPSLRCLNGPASCRSPVPVNKLHDHEPDGRFAARRVLGELRRRTAADVPDGTPGTSHAPAQEELDGDTGSSRVRYLRTRVWDVVSGESGRNHLITSSLQAFFNIT